MEWIEVEQSPEACTAAQLRALVDPILNKGAIDEAEAATDVTQNPAEAAVDTTGSSYNYPGEIEFAASVLQCLLCSGRVHLHRNGSVTTERCPVSGSCELTWVQLYGDNYLDDDGKLAVKRLPCAGVDCKAVLDLSMEDGAVAAAIAVGRCAVDVKGEEWNETGRAALNSMKPAFGLDEIEPFDGEPI